MTVSAHNLWSGLRFVLITLAVVLIVYLRLWSLESTRAGSWKKGHENLWKKPKRWQLILFCALWGFILIAFILDGIVYHR
jgi:hypothetical protein